MKASDDEGGSVLGLPEKMLKDELLVERAGSGRRLRLRVLRSREQQEHEEELCSGVGEGRDFSLTTHSI